ncbi:MAG: GNAT family N-acetyltransferase [Thermoanaerobaculia bacterium]|nr:GNAT family N-acetyltransferase [Thermoanaerobaculia bacterium]
MSALAVDLKVVHDLSEISRADWQGLLRDDDNPFVGWDFLEALERSGSAAPERGWWPCHLTAWHEDALLAAAPAYVKGDSAGDFSRDWGLADSAHRHGLSYYPKLVVGVPFSPVTGRRILVREDLDRAEMTRLLLALARELCRHSSVATIQVLYHRGDEIEALRGAGMTHRALVQYHWHNRDYDDFEDWLRSLPSKKRTQIRRERKEPARQDISIETVRSDRIGADPSHWADVVWRFYEANSRKHFWGGTYLNRDFYERLFTKAPEIVEVVAARRRGRVVAGALNLSGGSHLFGRYWGCHEEHRYLHFNVCIYHSVDECIRRGVRVFEGGAGGEHKLVRGFDPVLVHTSYLFLHDEFHDAAGRYFAAETDQRRSEIRRWESRRV